MRLAALGAGRSDDVGSTPPISNTHTLVQARVLRMTRNNKRGAMLELFRVLWEMMQLATYLTG